MAKYLICSDVHGDATSMKKVLEIFNEEKCDKILLLGDLLYHGPRNDLPSGYAPKEVIKMVNPLKDKIIMVRGNCEAEVDQMVLDFHIYKTKHLVIDGHNFYLEHGHHLDRFNPKFKPGDIVLSGHTHVSLCEEERGIYFINPGSTSIPKDSIGKEFMIYENGMITLYTLDHKLVYSKKIF